MDYLARYPLKLNIIPYRDVQYGILERCQMLKRLLYLVE